MYVSGCTVCHSSKRPTFMLSPAVTAAEFYADGCDSRSTFMMKFIASFRSQCLVYQPINIVFHKTWPNDQ